MSSVARDTELLPVKSIRQQSELFLGRAKHTTGDCRFNESFLQKELPHRQPGHLAEERLFKQIWSVVGTCNPA